MLEVLDTVSMKNGYDRIYALANIDFLFRKNKENKEIDIFLRQSYRWTINMGLQRCGEYICLSFMFIDQFSILTKKASKLLTLNCYVLRIHQKDRTKSFKHFRQPTFSSSSSSSSKRKDVERPPRRG